MDARSNPYTLILGPVLGVAAYILCKAFGLAAPVCSTVAITTLTAVWWITEALPIPATSLVPFVLFPVAGVLDQKAVASALGSHVIILLMGGFMIAKAIEKSDLHRRIALGMLAKTGGRSGKPLVFAFMASAALLSMWISNTAACLVLMPIALAVLSQLEDKSLTVPLVLAIAFACNIGGIATLVGTPTNLIFAGVYEEITGTEYSFGRWLGVGMPIVLIGLPLVALWLTRNIKQGKLVDLPTAGAWQQAEARALMVFCIIVFLWVFRLEPFGGWTGLLGLKGVGDSTVALFGVVLMFCIPSAKGSKDRLLDWKTAQDIPWGILLLFAGGIVIAKAFQTSGTAQLLGESLHGVTQFPPIFLMLCITLLLVFLTDITSNVATTSLFMPVMAAAATSANLPIEVMMLPAAIAASCAFMLPVATAPNAIAYGTGEVSIKTMMREGFVLNILMAVVIAVVCNWRLM